MLVINIHLFVLDTWSALTGSQEASPEEVKGVQQSPVVVNSNEDKLAPVEPNPSLSGRLAMYQGNPDVLMSPQTSHAIPQHNVSSPHQTIMSSAGLGTQPPIGSHLGSQPASGRQSLFMQQQQHHQQQQQPIGAHLGNSMRGNMSNLMPQVYNYLICYH